MGAGGEWGRRSSINTSITVVWEPEELRPGFFTGQMMKQYEKRNKKKIK